MLIVIPKVFTRKCQGCIGRCARVSLSFSILEEVVVWEAHDWQIFEELGEAEEEPFPMALLIRGFVMVMKLPQILPPRRNKGQFYSASSRLMGIVD
jgi:hypothetical protein